MVDSLGIIGGTGPLGRGLAGRFAQIGLDVTIGSREAARASEAAEKVVARLDAARDAGAEVATSGRVDGATNADVVDRDVVLVTVPASGLDAALPPLAGALAGRLVVSAVNPLAFDDAGPHPQRLPAGSAAQQVAALLPEARVTAAFHAVSSANLRRLDVPLDDDIAVVGDDPTGVDEVAALIDRLPGARGLAAGPLRLAAPLEDLTAVLLTVNRRYDAHAGLRLSRVSTI